MRQITAIEALSMSKLLQAEANALTMAKAGLSMMNDEQLKSLVQSGITSSEARIRGIQQFISENKITSTGEVQ